MTSSTPVLLPLSYLEDAIKLAEKHNLESLSLPYGVKIARRPSAVPPQPAPKLDTEPTTVEELDAEIAQALKGPKV